MVQLLFYFLPHWISTFNYYSSDDALFYINERYEQFSYDSGTDKINTSKTELQFKGDYIFRRGELIDFETLGHNRFEDDEVDLEEVLLQEMNAYKQLLEENK